MADQQNTLLIVVGSGEVTQEEVNDLLDDAYPDVDNVDLMVPVDKDLYTNSVQAVVAWFDADNVVIPVKTEGASLSRRSAALGGEEGPEEVSSFVDVFGESFNDFAEVHVLVALPEPEDDEFDRYASLAEAAISAENVDKVLNLCRGLDDIVIDDSAPAEEENEPEPEPEPEPEKPKRSRRKPASEPKAEPETLEQEVAEAVRQRGPEKQPAAKVQNALNTLGDVVSFLEKNDEMFALRNLADEVIYAPITNAAQEALQTLSACIGSGDAQSPTETPAEPEKAPKRGRGRPRTNFEVNQIFDEDEDAWVDRPKGRLRKGTKWRVIHSETNEVLDEGTA